MEKVSKKTANKKTAKRVAKKKVAKNAVLDELQEKPEKNQFSLRSAAIAKTERDEWGLLKGVDYVFKEDGFIDWKAMVKEEYLYPNKDWFILKKKDIPKTIEGLKDEQLLIMLGGIKELAKLRGFTHVSYQVKHVSKQYVKARCSIHWTANYETSNKGISYEEYANASYENTSDFCVKFLETIACNRAFVRCVRNFLNISIVGADEIDLSEDAYNSASVSYNGEDSSSVNLTPQSILGKAFKDFQKKENGGEPTFEEFKSYVCALENFEGLEKTEIDNWGEFKDVPPKICRKLLAKLSRPKSAKLL